MKIRKTTIICLVLMLVVISSACANKDKPTTATPDTGQNTGSQSQSADLRLVYWYPDTEEAIKQIHNIFIEKHPGSSVTLEIIPGDAYEQVLSTRILSGAGPDLYFFFGQSIWRQGSNGHYADITDKAFVANVKPEFLDAATYDGKVYGIPLNFSASGIFYNQDVFDDVGVEPPKTFAEFLDICQKIKDAGYEPLAMGGADLWVHVFTFGAFYESFVGYYNPSIQMDIYTGATTFSTDPNFRTAFTKYKELSDKGFIMKGALSTTHTQAVQEVADGNAAMYIMGEWIYAEIMDANPNANIGSFLLPNDEGGTAAGGAPELGIGVWPGSENLDLAMELLAIYASPEANEILCNAIKSSPCIAGVNVDLGPTLVAHNKLVSQQQYMFTWMDDYFPAPMVEGWRKDAQSLIGGSMTIDELLASMDAQYSKDRDMALTPITM